MNKEISAGAIILENKKVLLVHQINGVYGFPKGHVEKGETLIETAIRETKEETNLDIEIISPKEYKITYNINSNTSKECVYFAGRRINGEIKKQEQEIKELFWIDYEEAFKYLQYEDVKSLYKNFLIDNNYPLQK